MKNYAQYLLARVLNSNVEEWDQRDKDKGTGTVVLLTPHYKVELVQIYRMTSRERDYDMEYAIIVYFGGHQFNALMINPHSNLFERIDVLYKDISASVLEKMENRAQEFVALLEREKVEPISLDSLDIV